MVLTRCATLAEETHKKKFKYLKSNDIVQCGTSVKKDLAFMGKPVALTSAFFVWEQQHLFGFTLVMLYQL